MIQEPIYKLDETIINNLDYFELSSNKNAIHILEKKLYKVDWQQLSKNPNAIHILGKIII